MVMMLKDELERIRAERGWTLLRMAEELRVSEATYRHFIAGHNRAGRKILGGVALAFPQVNVTYYAAQDIRDTGRGGLAVEAPTEPQDSIETSFEYPSANESKNGR